MVWRGFSIRLFLHRERGSNSLLPRSSPLERVYRSETCKTIICIKLRNGIAALYISSNTLA
jgi:hypothetical protein